LSFASGTNETEDQYIAAMATSIPPEDTKLNGWAVVFCSIFPIFPESVDRAKGKTRPLSE